jgi:hypothetical protein
MIPNEYDQNMMMLVVDVHSLSFHGFHDLEACSFYNAVSRHCLTHWQALWPTGPFQHYQPETYLRHTCLESAQCTKEQVLGNYKHLLAVEEAFLKRIIAFLICE